MKVFTRIGLMLVVGVAVAACSNNPGNPIAPSAAGPGIASAVPEGSPTLKVTTPDGPLPAAGEELQTVDGVVLSVNTAKTRFAGDVALQTRFQLHEETTLIAEPIVAAGPDGRSAWAVDQPLKQGTTYRWRARAEYGDAYGPWSTVWEFRTPAAPTVGGGGGGFRTPDPPPGQRLPLPNRAHVVAAAFAERPDLVRRSCQEHGGTWEFMDYLVDKLRLEDNRWGYNGKRGNVNDPSQDVVAYHWGAGPSEGSTQVYIIDIMFQHCGSNPQPAWIDQTGETARQGSIGRWTGRGRFTN